ncbi:MAG TPA: hypothetical protein VM597_24125 [Gemmataceae bacterium]|nr:hypothetical protein [Gemmataceae bacterium]
MATETPSSVVRSILTANLTLPADEVIRRAKARGVTAPAEKVRALVHNIRSEVKKAAGASNALPVVPKAAGASRPLPVPPAQAADPAAPELAGVLANVALVHRVVHAAGGVEPARQVAEAVRACGGVTEFLQHLDLIAGMQG